ncbi:MAG: DUF5105 domain-containing protein [Vagococcus sp.]|uniref:DUF5105 domain-containing protein n=1 Tax=Vagococcus sp. TaxID=1933889 RepID=UPI002FC5DE31
MKKIKMLVVPMILAVVLTACSGSEQKNKVATIEVKDGSYVQLDGSSDKETVELDVKLKNNSDNKFIVMEDSFYLVEKGNDEKIKEKDMTSGDLITTDIYKSIINGDLSPEKSLSGKIFFDIKKDTEYSLFFTSHSFEEKTGKSHDDVEIPLDLKKFEDSKKSLDEPIKALNAYIDEVLLNKENKDYEKLVENDKTKEKELIKNAFSKEFTNFMFSGNSSDEQINKLFEQYTKAQSSHFKVETELDTRLSDVAIINAKMTGINSESISAGILKVKTEYYDKTGDFDQEKENEYAVNNFEKVLKDAKVGHLTDTKITLTKEKDKWKIAMDTDKLYENKKLISSYLGSNY